jgi:hypothetical protein
MALDPKVTVQTVADFVASERKDVDEKHTKEKDDETRAYFAGQSDLLERLEALLAG